MPEKRISIIIPTLNESSHIRRTLASCGEAAEIIVVDAGSKDETRAVAKEYGAVVLESRASKGLQLNRGAKIASGDLLLFLHADTLLPQGFAALLGPTLDRPGVLAGAFRLRIDNNSRKAFRLLEWLIHLRSRFLQLPYGDQALFLGRSTFEAYGPFPEIEIMEDFQFVRSLRKAGSIALVDAAVITSDRRWSRLGILRTTLINQLMVFGYLAGISPKKLAGFYRTQKKN